MEAEGGALAFSVDGDGEFFDFLGDILGDESPEVRSPLLLHPNECHHGLTRSLRCASGIVVQTKKVQVTQAQEPSASCMNRTHTSSCRR